MKNEQERYIVPPEGGWQEHTWYLVLVSWGKGNPVHYGIMFTGFLDRDGEPGGYSGITPIRYIEDNPFQKAYYLKAMKILLDVRDFPFFVGMPGSFIEKDMIEIEE